MLTPDVVPDGAKEVRKTTNKGSKTRVAPTHNRMGLSQSRRSERVNPARLLEFEESCWFDGMME
jgi:hypothetical protein